MIAVGSENLMDLVARNRNDGEQLEFIAAGWWTVQCRDAAGGLGVDDTTHTNLNRQVWRSSE